MDIHLLKQANAVVIGYRRAYSEKISMSIFDDPGATRAVLERGIAGENEELKTACMEMAKAVGISLAGGSKSSRPVGETASGVSSALKTTTAAPAPTPAPASVLKPGASISGVSAAQWAVIEAAAIKVGGPICAMLVSQVREDGAESFDDAIETLAQMIGGGSMGTELKREARGGKR